METYRDMATSMLDVYLSSMSLRTNEIMRVLTSSPRSSSR